jgi:hypothetical protein
MGDELDEEIILRDIDTDAENPAVEVAKVIAEIEDKDVTDLPPMHGCIDGVLDNIFSDPPSDEAQMQVEFTFQTYRVTVGQTGQVQFVKTG